MYNEKYLLNRGTCAWTQRIVWQKQGKNITRLALSPDGQQIGILTEYGQAYMSVDYGTTFYDTFWLSPNRPTLGFIPGLDPNTPGNQTFISKPEQGWGLNYDTTTGLIQLHILDVTKYYSLNGDWTQQYTAQAVPGCA